MPLRSRGASRRGARCWRRRSAKVSARARSWSCLPVAGSARSVVWRDTAQEAWQHARQALDLARQQKARGYEAHALHQLGIVYAHADPPDIAQAETHYQQALALADELGMRPLAGPLPPRPRHAVRQTGQREQARAALTTAIDLYRAMDMTFWLPQAEAALAQVERQ